VICLFGKCLTYVEAAWITFGFLGQGIFFMRWIVQWLTSERHAESRIPIAFWYLSLIGGLITLAYAIHIRDPVFFVGQLLGALVYVRNLILIYRSRSASEVTAATAPPKT
jgi:lipid-A-disaccharide synthase-like uncharacterized protein